MKIFLLPFLILILSLHSCENEKENNSVLYSTWEAKDFVSIDSAAYPKKENTKVLLTFQSTGKYTLKLEVNNCAGNFATGNNNQIEIESGACTEACCDSKFAEKVASMISRVTSYKIERNTLKLNVPQWGYIELVRSN